MEQVVHSHLSQICACPAGQVVFGDSGIHGACVYFCLSTWDFVLPSSNHCSTQHSIRDSLAGPVFLEESLFTICSPSACSLAAMLETRMEDLTHFPVAFLLPFSSGVLLCDIRAWVFGRVTPTSMFMRLISQHSGVSGYFPGMPVQRRRQQSASYFALVPRRSKRFA